jgi:hypothetical protein
MDYTRTFQHTDEVLQQGDEHACEVNNRNGLFIVYLLKTRISGYSFSN